ncbi:MAG: hypothetical protein ACOC3X_00975 [Nanoarchaeota archaeon]
MIKYTNKFERIINKLVIISIIAILIMLFIEFILKKTKYLEIFLIIDLFINLIFVIDLKINYKKRKSFKSFLKNHFLDIIACIPFNNLFRTVKIVSKITIFLKIISKNSSILKIISKTPIIKIILISKSAKILSKKNENKK